MSGTSVMLGCASGGFLERLLDRPAGGVGDVDDAAVAVPALAGQVPAVAIGFEVERHAKLGEAGDRRGGFGHDMLDDGAIVEPGARLHRIADVIFEAVVGFEHRGDPALRPARRALAQRALRDHARPSGSARASAPRSALPRPTR